MGKFNLVLTMVDHKEEPSSEERKLRIALFKKQHGCDDQVSSDGRLGLFIPYSAIIVADEPYSDTR
jgi:hypothetical protein